MPVIIVVIPRQLDADLTSTQTQTATPFSAGSTLTLNLSLQDTDGAQGPITVFLACTALDGNQASILPLDTIVQEYTDTITVAPGTTTLSAEIATQSEITPGLLLLVQIVAVDGAEMGCARQLFQVQASDPQTSQISL